MNRLAAPLGPEVIAKLLPHRPPLLLVDEVRALHGPPRSELVASFAVRADHPVLAGHFPGRPIWPGALTIEGLAQAANLLGVLLPRVPERGPLELDAALEDPREPELGGLLAAVDVKLLQVVEPGAQLDYRVRLVGEYGGLRRVEVSAGVGRREVARGSIAVVLV